MHNTLDAVQVVMELTLEYRLKVSLHALAGNLYHVADAVLAAYLELVEVRSDYFDLVVLNLRCVLCLNQLEAVHTGTVELNLHIFTTDNLAFECRRKRNRNINIGNFDLNISGFQRNLIKISNIRACDQRTRNFCNVFIFIGNHRESKFDCSCTSSQNHIIDRFKRIDKCRYSL